MEETNSFDRWKIIVFPNRFLSRFERFARTNDEMTEWPNHLHLQNWFRYNFFFCSIFDSFDIQQFRFCLYDTIDMIFN